MKRNVFVDGQRLDWRELPAQDIEQVETGVYSILYNGRSFEARLTPTAEGLAVTVKGQSFLVEVTDPRNFSSREQADAGAGRQELKSPMPGKVIRVLVEVGDQVHAGQGLVVVEAMKMQNEMKASRDGVVTRVAAKGGDTVCAGDVLVTLE